MYDGLQRIHTPKRASEAGEGLRMADRNRVAGRRWLEAFRLLD